jgi:hypothetical protein
MRYSQEEKDFLNDTIPGRSFKETMELFNQKFENKITAKRVRNYCSNHRIKTGTVSRFQEGHIPHNKGKKGGSWSPTQFQKGHVPHNTLAVGSERISSDGYLQVKKKNGKWVRKHMMLWEKHHGKIPRGHCIIFGDKNKMNCEIENLVLVTRQQLVIMNKRNLIKDNTEGTKTGVIIADIMRKIANIQKRGK